MYVCVYGVYVCMYVCSMQKRVFVWGGKILTDSADLEHEVLARRLVCVCICGVCVCMYVVCETECVYDEILTDQQILEDEVLARRLVRVCMCVWGICMYLRVCMCVCSMQKRVFVL